MAAMPGQLGRVPRSRSASLQFVRRWAGLDRLELVRSRRDADRCLLNAEAGAPTSSTFAWRVAELTDARQRRVLAAALRGLGADRLLPLADRLEQLDEPVTPQAILLVREVVSNGGVSPHELERILDKLDGR